MILLTLFWLFAKISMFTFGGGYAMVPLFQEEIVTKGGYMSAEEFANLVALAQMTPGPLGLNAATYVGYSQAGIAGAFVCTLGVSTPPFIIAMIAALFISTMKDNRYIKIALSGIRPAVIGLIATAVLFFAGTSLYFVNDQQFSICWQGCLIFAVTLFLQIKYKVNMLITLLIAAVLGVLLFMF